MNPDYETTIELDIGGGITIQMDVGIDYDLGTMEMGFEYIKVTASYIEVDGEWKKLTAITTDALPILIAGKIKDHFEGLDCFENFYHAKGCSGFRNPDPEAASYWREESAW